MLSDGVPLIGPPLMRDFAGPKGRKESFIRGGPVQRTPVKGLIAVWDNWEPCLQLMLDRM
jgi:hypothetical protein